MAGFELLSETHHRDNAPALTSVKATAEQQLLLSHPSYSPDPAADVFLFCEIKLAANFTTAVTEYLYDAMTSPTLTSTLHFALVINRLRFQIIRTIGFVRP